MASEPHTIGSRAPAKYQYRWHSAAFFAVMFALAMVALIATIVSSRASSTPLLDDNTMSAARAMATTQLPKQVPLASAGDLQLMLPIFEHEVSAIGYHPVSDDNVVSLVPTGSQANTSLISRAVNLVLPDGEGPLYFLMGEGSGAGNVTASIDIGAAAGSVIYAPVDGTVAGIKSYQAKGKCEDTEIRIQPRSQSRFQVIMTHVDNTSISLGQPVKAGVSRLGAVRSMDACMAQALGRYTYDNGNHLHMQVELFR